MPENSQEFKPFSEANMVEMLPVIVSDLKHHVEKNRQYPTNKNIARDMYAHVIRGLYAEKTFLSNEKLDDGSLRTGCFIKGYACDIWSYLDGAYALIHDTDFEALIAKNTQPQSDDFES